MSNLRQRYYVFRQAAFPKSRIEKCGFRQSTWTTVQWILTRTKKGNYFIERSKAFDKGNKIVSKNDNYIVYKNEFGVWYAVSRIRDIPTEFSY